MNIEFLYPKVANLYGEAVEIEFIKKALPEASFYEAGLRDEPYFAAHEVDMLYLGPMSEHSQELVIKALMPYKNRLSELIDSGCVFLCVGNALEIFGKEIQNENGSTVPALGIFDTVAKRQMMNRYNSVYYGTLENMKILGFKAQFSHSYGQAPGEGLFQNVKGDGLAPGSGYEGLRRKNFFGTYVLGPILILNPDFAKYILKLAAKREVALPCEQALYQAYERRLKEYNRPDMKL